MEEFDALGKLDEICGLLDELNCKYEIHERDGGEFSYLEDGDVCVKIPNPYADRPMFIDIQQEISLYFADWHAHYTACENDCAEFCETLRGFLENELCSAAYFLGDKREWGGSTTAFRADVLQKPPEECFGMPVMARVYGERWEKNGAEVRFLFWDASYDKIVVIEKNGAEDNSRSGY